MPRADRWLVVVARDPAGAKSRLAEVLTAEERARLAIALLEDVLDAVRAADEARVLVATESRRVADVADAHGATPLAVPAAGTRAAARAALAAAVGARASVAAILPADLPALRPEDVAALFSAADGAPVTLAPDRHARGTNALVLRPPDAIEPLFGADSLAAHREAAARHGLDVRVVVRPGLALDIDDRDDLRAAMASVATLGTRTASVLPALLAFSG